MVIVRLFVLMTLGMYDTVSRCTCYSQGLVTLWEAGKALMGYLSQGVSNIHVPRVFWRVYSYLMGLHLRCSPLEILPSGETWVLHILSLYFLVFSAVYCPFSNIILICGQLNLQYSIVPQLVVLLWS